MTIWQNKIKRLVRNTQNAVEGVYIDTMREATEILKQEVGDYPSLTSFNPADYPSVERRLNMSLYSTYEKVYAIAEKSVKKGWKIADNKSNRLTKRIIKETGLNARLFDKKWSATDTEAIKQFTKRKRNGMNLSDRVWNINKNFENEVIDLLQYMVKEGKTPQQMNKDFRRYLNHPDTIAERLRDEKGRFKGVVYANQNVGRGVYRSAYKNARRLILTETNMAYRRAEWEKYLKQDFVIGFEIKLSDHHDIYDICDELQGRYPKEFCWTGWHPLCECEMFPILKSIDEVKHDIELILKGKQTKQSVHRVKGMPTQFKQYVKTNYKKIVGAKSTPYWYQDYLDYKSRKK